MRPLLTLALLALTLPSCGDAPGFDASLYENDPGEAIVRHLQTNVPEFRGDHIYCIVLGPIPRGANPEFVKRFDDLDLTFVQSDRLTVRHQDKVPYDPKTELSPIFLQISTPTNTLTSGGNVEAAWAYKRKFRKVILTLEESSDGKWSVSDSQLREESLDDTWTPPWDNK